MDDLLARGCGPPGLVDILGVVGPTVVEIIQRNEFGAIRW